MLELGNGMNESAVRKGVRGAWNEVYCGATLQINRLLKEESGPQRKTIDQVQVGYVKN